MRAYTAAVETLERERARASLQLDFLAAQGRGKDVARVLRNLDET